MAAQNDGKTESKAFVLPVFCSHVTRSVKSVPCEMACSLTVNRKELVNLAALWLVGSSAAPALALVSPSREVWWIAKVWWIANPPNFHSGIAVGNHNRQRSKTARVIMMSERRMGSSARPPLAVGRNARAARKSSSPKLLTLQDQQPR